MTRKPQGQLVIVGGHEDKTGNQEILGFIAEKADNQPLTIVTVATQQPEETAEEYTRVFKNLGVKKIEVVDIRSRNEAHEQQNVEKIAEAAAIFFTGGDQLRITSQIGDSPLFQCLQERYLDGVTIAGTSAGAAAMPETMLISGAGDESNRISALEMAPGLGFINGVVIDTHFAERGRMGRILGVVAQNPRNLGIGIDEDTAIVVKDGHFRVLGTGAVYVVDGAGVSYSSLSEKQPEGILSVFDVVLHVLGDEDKFDLARRRPVAPRAVQQEKA
jgi:cyanophycinase